MTIRPLRWYQEEAINSLFQYFYNNNGNPVIALPTGSGKSMVIAKFLEMIMSQWPGQRVMCLTHVKELVKQNALELRAVWEMAPAGIYSSGLKQRDLHYPITFGNVQSVSRVVELFGHIDLLIIDEAHLLGPNDDGNYNLIISSLRSINPKLKVIGLTATAWRTGMGLLTNGPIFTDICYNICDIPGFRRLFDEGYLVPPYAKKTENEYDISSVGMSNGEYAKGELNRVTANEAITWAALNESLQKGHDKNCRLVFCTGIEHAVLAAKMLKHIGLRAEAIHSRMSDSERDGIIAAFQAGEIDTITNNGILTTGFNHPPVDHIIMLRPTMSVGLWVQMLGRGTRPYECNGWHKLDCLVTDHAGNARRLGTIDDPFIPKMRVKGGGDAPVKICPVCGTYNHAAARFCDSCGEPFQTKVGFKEKAFDDQLVRSDLPIYETYEVQQVYYTSYLKKAATPLDKPTLKATYQCGLMRFTEYVAIENAGFPGKRARDWWRQRFPSEGFVPATVNEAMSFIDRLVAPKAIKVWVNRKYPEIVGYEY